MPVIDISSMDPIRNGWDRFSTMVQNNLTHQVETFLKAHLDADLHIVTGHARVGKSSWIKSMTGEDVYIGSTLKSATQKVSLVPATIGNKRCLFLDMPGFGTCDFDDWDIFYKLMTAMSVVRPYVEFKGVTYVDSMKSDSVTPEAEKILTWLSLFCGQDFMPNVTVVTTKWDGNDADGIKEKLTRVEQWKEEKIFRPFFSHGATIYHHGLLVEGSKEGDDKYTTLHVDRKAAERRVKAHNYFATRYRNSPKLQLQIYTEIANGATIETTSAGKWLRYGHTAAPSQDDERADPNASTGHASAHEEHHRETDSNDDSSSEDEGGFSFSYEDCKPWIKLLITAARMFGSWSSSRESGRAPFYDEDFSNMFEDGYDPFGSGFPDKEEKPPSSWWECSFM
ncbi:hypothetical protein AFUA_7G00890 [Paecilomyces variotii No. 5]|uniref:G domain-containing protein n=1 Tax=Byssochlamys spectabilis (strain No. 5 / NBRC 109023) TaxID=1356009 RepID=V5FYV9_BYSSN|nr:hypothetical protein AFUA_7G00890 [Paecilomyces variotii No. 5]